MPNLEAMANDNASLPKEIRILLILGLQLRLTKSIIKVNLWARVRIQFGSNSARTPLGARSVAKAKGSDALLKQARIPFELGFELRFTEAI